MTDQTDQVIEVEGREAAPLATRTPPQPQNGAQAGPITLFGTAKPAEVVAAATETATALTGIIQEKQLYKKIGDRNHVLVEGWTLLGSLLGVFPVTIYTQKVTGDDGAWSPPKTNVGPKTLHSKFCKNGSDGHAQKEGCQTYEKDNYVEVLEAGHGGWEARVEAHTRSGDVIGAAESECRWEEPHWRDRDSHALRSMAQTRATAKALRMPLGFIVELAGFAATPAEEMDAIADTPAEEDNGYRCPTCGSGVYDNRDDRQSDKSPMFRCKNKDCTGGNGGRPWATWDPHFFEDPVVKAKKQVLATVKAHKAAWKVYFPEEDPTYDTELAELIRAAYAADDTAQMAGILWNYLADNFAKRDEPTAFDLRVITAAAAAALEAAGDDANDILTSEEAWQRAEGNVAAADTTDYDDGVGY